MKSHPADNGYINRTAIVVKPKKPFFEFIKKYVKYDFDLDEEQEFQNGDAAIYLLPAIDSVEDMEEWLKTNYDIIFRQRLNAVIENIEVFLEIRTFEMFKEWFDYSLHSEVWDIMDIPVVKFQ